MVKGTTRQVIVINGTQDASFDQAIFLVREDLLSKGGMSEDALLKEARLACKSEKHPHALPNALSSLCGAALIGLVWLLTACL